MGYTHYFRRKKVLPERKFKLAAAECQLIVEHLSREEGYEVVEDCDRSHTGPTFSPDLIRFNGPGELGHETFYVTREMEPHAWSEPENGLWFEFCKTAQKPYDSAVCASLIVLNHHFGDKGFKVSSDGEDDDEGWVSARGACQYLLGYGEDFELPDNRLFGRMSINGMPKKAIEFPPQALFGRAVKLNKLANGWCVRQYAGRGKEKWNTPLDLMLDGNKTIVFKDEWTAVRSQSDGILLRCGNLGEARMRSASMFLRDVFGELPQAELFIVGFDSTGDWAYLSAWSDLIEEKGDLKSANKLRSVLPR